MVPGAVSGGYAARTPFTRHSTFHIPATQDAPPSPHRQTRHPHVSARPSGLSGLSGPVVSAIVMCIAALRRQPAVKVTLSPVAAAVDRDATMLPSPRGSKSPKYSHHAACAQGRASLRR